jgi:protein phosphatase 1G
MDKEQEEGENDWLKYASTSMQGWRVSQEDAHNAIIDFAGNSALFAVYDGHGGSEVAAYAAENLPAILQQNENFKKGDIEKALTECFIDFDKTLLTEDVAAILQSLKESAEGKPKNRPKESEDDEGELWEEAAALSKEAEVSVDKIVKEYMKMNKRLHDHFGIVYEKESAEHSVERIVKRRRVIEVTEEGDAPAEANGKDVKDENGTPKKNGVVSKSDTEEPKTEDAPSDDTIAQFSDTDEATEDTEKLTLKTTVEVTTKKPLSNGDNTSEIESKDNGDGENTK